MSYKRGIQEMGQRLCDRGLLDERDDIHFLGKLEAYALFGGDTARLPLLKAKVKARKRDFFRFYNKEIVPPMYIQGYRVVDPGGPDDADGDTGALRGTPTAASKEVVGVARVIDRIDQVGRLRPGEIMVTNSTDPGWTPVFLILSGVIVETGGVLSHSGCLCREYGMPAVQLPGATRRIADGATIRLDGGSGTVTILSEPGASPSAPDQAPAEPRVTA
jgi:pyruvate,water dikinase